jgi:hypothetical protein
VPTPAAAESARTASSTPAVPILPTASSTPASTGAPTTTGPPPPGQRE